MVDGPTVMLGYWGRPPQRRARTAPATSSGSLPDGAFDYVGRRDHDGQGARLPGRAR